MEVLLQQFPDKIVGNDEKQLFENFYSNHNYKIFEWFQNYTKKAVVTKNEKEAERFKKMGNSYYIKKQLKHALHFYNKSLRHSPHNSIIFSLTLANRSAVHFELSNYDHCINDIELALKSAYPNHLKPKIYIRKAECHALLKEGDMMENCKIAANKLINTFDIEPKAKEKYLKQLQKITVKSENYFEKVPNKIVVDSCNFEENQNFSNASSAIGINYSSIKGRHVIANRNIDQGEILFREKAFAFAPIFVKKQELVDKCYYCLSDIANPIFCRYCVTCKFCKQDCYNNSWHECHKYECLGIQLDLWHDIGIGFPALRAVFKGINSILQEFSTKDAQEIIFNNQLNLKEDNYLCFNNLLTSLDKIDDVTPLLVSASVVVLYLQEKTDFLTEIYNRFKQISKFNILIKIGAAILRHIAQFSLNSSIIEHWIIDKNCIKDYPKKSVQVACGIFPSISIMNHSCKSNVSIYYENDVAIVKALSAISKDSEIFNCYGIDYRFMKKLDRQQDLLSLYHFVCDCEICENPSLEIDIFNYYLCPNCQGPVKPAYKSSTGQCVFCKTKVYLQNYFRRENTVKGLLDACDNKSLKQLDDIHDLLKDTFFKHHKYFENCYKKYVTYYTSHKSLNLALQYFEKQINLTKARMGNNAKQVAINQYEYILGLIENVIEPFTNSALYKDIIKKMIFMSIEVKSLLLLYYPNTALNLQKIDDFINVNN